MEHLAPMLLLFSFHRIPSRSIQTLFHVKSKLCMTQQRRLEQRVLKREDVSVFEVPFVDYSEVASGLLR